MAGSDDVSAGPSASALADRLILPRYNLRDYGGVPAMDGARLTSGKFFRSAELDRCHPHEADLLEKLGVEALADFRGPGEVPATLPAAHPRFTGKRFATKNADLVIPHAVDHFAALNSPADAQAALAGTYRKFALSDHFLVTLKLYFTMLAETAAPTLIHCFAGKDRTGIAVALLQTHLGVHRDDVAQEFIITDAAGEVRVAYLRDAMTAGGARAILPEVLDEVLTVRPEYLQGAFAEITDRYGSVERYLREAAHIDEATLSALPDRCLA